MRGWPLLFGQDEPKLSVCLKECLGKGLLRGACPFRVLLRKPHCWSQLPGELWCFIVEKIRFSSPINFAWYIRVNQGKSQKERERAFSGVAVGVKRRWAGWGGGRKLTWDGGKSQERLAGCCDRCKGKSHGSQTWKGRQEMECNLGLWGSESCSGLPDSAALPSVSSRKKQRFREVLWPARALAGGSLPGLTCRCPHFQAWDGAGRGGSKQWVRLDFARRCTQGTTWAVLTTVPWGTQTLLPDDATEAQRGKVLSQCAEVGSWRSGMESRLVPKPTPKPSAWTLGPAACPSTRKQLGFQWPKGMSKPNQDKVTYNSYSLFMSSFPFWLQHI